MKNFIQEGDIIVVPAPAPGVNSGDFVLVGTIGGVSQLTAATGADAPLLTEGVFTLAKDTAAAWAQGDALYWDNTNKRFTKTAAANTLFGQAAAAALITDAFGAVKIYPK